MRNDIDLNVFDKQVDVEKLVQEFQMTLRKNESSAMWRKYDTPDGDLIVIKKQTNTWFAPKGRNGRDKGGAALLINEFYANGDWTKTFEKMAEVLNIPLEYKPKYSPDKVSSARFNDKKRKGQKWYIENKTSPFNHHDYLTEERLISPTLLKQSRFLNSIRVPKDSGGFRNVLAVHRDHKGICAYEKHNSTHSGTLNILSKSRKCLWYSDDVFAPETKRVFIGEAFIDALSFATLVEKTDPDVALMTFGGKFDSGAKKLIKDEGGEAKEVFDNEHYFVKSLRSIFDKCHAEQILLSCDNDPTGHEYNAFFADFFNEFYPDKFTILKNYPPLHLKDWNDFLVVHRFDQKAQHLDLACKTKRVYFSESGIGCFRIIPSKQNPGSTLITLPPAGFMTGKMAVVAKSFIAAMHKSDPNAEITYSASRRTKNCSYAKNIEEFRRTYIPQMAYHKTGKTDILSTIVNKQQLKDKSILPDWPGYREIVNKPHSFADHIGDLIITKCKGDKVRYFHNNTDPVKMILAVPGALTEDHKYEVRSLVRDVLRFREPGDLTVYYSPCDDGTGNHNNAHCEFFNRELMALKKPNKHGDSLESEINQMTIKKGKPFEGAASILHHLHKEGLLKAHKHVATTGEPVNNPQKKKAPENTKPAVGM